MVFFGMASARRGRCDLQDLWCRRRQVMTRTRYDWRTTSAASASRRPTQSPESSASRRPPHDRVRAGISFALTEAMDEGHCGLPPHELIRSREELLEVPSRS